MTSGHLGDRVPRPKKDTVGAKLRELESRERDKKREI